MAESCGPDSGRHSCSVRRCAATSRVGVEEELTIVDPQTLGQVLPSTACSSLPTATRDSSESLKNTQVELVTAVAGNALGATLLAARARTDLADRLGGELYLLASGAYPGSGSSGEVVAGERHEQIADEYVSAAARSLPCGQHVHVAVPGADLGRSPCTAPPARSCPS